MRKVVFDINITADGYCNHTDMIADDEMLGYHTRVLRNASLLLFGRITYQLMVPYWPDVAKRQSETAAVNESAGQATAGLSWLGDLSIRRRRPSLQKACVNRNAVRRPRINMCLNFNILKSNVLPDRTSLRRYAKPYEPAHPSK